MLRRRLGLMAWALMTQPKVYPSGAALATASVPIIVPAPGLFSTMTGCFHLSESACAITRAATSFEAPAVAGTMKWTGLLGHSAASAGTARIAAIANVNDFSERVDIEMFL